MARREKLLDLRDVALRLALGDYGDRCLRDLFVEFVDVLTDTETTTESMALAGARAPMIDPQQLVGGVKAGVAAQIAPLAPPAGAKRDAPAPSADVPDPAGEEWLAQLAAADEKAEAEAAAAAAAAKTDGAKAPAAPKPKTEPKAAPTPNGGH